jgi:thiazole synthase
MIVSVNGKERNIPENLTILQFLTSCDLRPELVAVERNRQIVPRRQFAEVLICDGDELEIVHMVGGG